MALPQQQIGAFDDSPLEQRDVTHDVLDRLHAGGDEKGIFDYAVFHERQAQRLRSTKWYRSGSYRGGNERQMRELTDDASDADIFKSVME